MPVAREIIEVEFMAAAKMLAEGPLRHHRPLTSQEHDQMKATYGTAVKVLLERCEDQLDYEPDLLCELPAGSHELLVEVERLLRMCAMLVFFGVCRIDQLDCLCAHLDRAL